MRIIELSEQVGVSVAALKYYVRERLLPPGQRLAGNLTTYDDTHVRRARLVRALLGAGGLSVAQVRGVLATLDDGAPLAQTFEAAQNAMSAADRPPAPSHPSLERVWELTQQHAWTVTDDNPGLVHAAAVLDGFGEISYAPSAAFLAAYAHAAAIIAQADLEALRDRHDPDAVAELMVVGTVLGDALLAGLRRLAQQHVTARLFAVDSGGGPDRHSLPHRPTEGAR